MIENTLFHAISWTLIHSIWQGFILALFAGMVVHLTKKWTSALRYLLFAFLFVGFIIGSGLTFFHLLQQETSFIGFVHQIPSREIAIE